MAQVETVSYLDDLDPTQEATHRDVPFGIDGKHYQIDLSDASRARLDAALAPYLASARRAGRNGTVRIGARRGGTATAPPSPTTGAREQNTAVREWARAQGMEIADRGRIPTEVLEAYQQSAGRPAAVPEPTAELAPEPGPVPEQRAEEEVATEEPKRRPGRAKAKGKKEPQRFATRPALNRAVREWSAGRSKPLRSNRPVPDDVMRAWVHEFGEPVIEG